MESQSLQESPTKSSPIVIPEDFESQKEMVKSCFQLMQMFCSSFVYSLFIFLISHLSLKFIFLCPVPFYSELYGLILWHETKV